MKANAPEKIYRTTFYLDDDKGDTKWKKTPVAGAENIEYIRTDALTEAFIEKAAIWFNNNFVVHDEFSVMSDSFNTKEEMFDDFKKYMGGE